MRRKNRGLPNGTHSATTACGHYASCPSGTCCGGPSQTGAGGAAGVMTGKPFLWKNLGLDAVKGKAPGPYLAQLQFTPAEQKVLLEKIAKKDGVMTTFKRGDVLGLMTTGSGKLRTNTTVQFDKGDNRMRVYTHE